MRIAVLSDIHGNLEAFESVLDDIARRRADTIVSLGDNVGYGADSEAVVRLLVSRGIISVLGNHELACINEKVYKWYVSDVKKSVDITMANLSEASFAYLRGLAVNLSMENAFFVHGFWPDSVRHYLHQIDIDQLMDTLKKLKEGLCFVGHTHKLNMVFQEKGGIRIQKMDQTNICLEKDKKYIINAGSVGQPRDGDPRAKYLIWDLKNHCLEIRCVEYDNQQAAKKILKAGIPAKYALAVDMDIKL